MAQTPQTTAAPAKATKSPAKVTAAKTTDASASGGSADAGDTSISKLESAIPLLVALLAAAGVTTTADLTRMERVAPGLSAAAFALTGVAIALAFIAGAEYIRHPRTTTRTTRTARPATKETPASAAAIASTPQPPADEHAWRRFLLAVVKHRWSRTLFGSPGRRRQYRFTVYSSLALAGAFVCVAVAVISTPSDAPVVDETVIGPPLTLRVHVTASAVATGNLLAVAVQPRAPRPCAEPTPASAPALCAPSAASTTPATPAPAVVLAWRVLGAKSDGTVDATVDVQLVGLTGNDIGVYACVVPPSEATPQHVVSAASMSGRCATAEMFIPAAADPGAGASPSPTPTKSPSPSPSPSASSS